MTANYFKVKSKAAEEYFFHAATTQSRASALRAARTRARELAFASVSSWMPDPEVLRIGEAGPEGGA